VLEVYLFLRDEGKLESFIKKNKTLVFLILLFLIELSLGVFYAINTKEFLLRYKDVYLGFILFFLGGLYLRKLEGVAKVVAVGLFLSFAYQALIFFFPSIFRTIAKLLVYDRHLGLVLDNIDRGRIYIETFDEAVFLIFLAWLAKKFLKKERFFAIILFAIIGFFALISNFRTRVLLWIISLAGYIFYKVREKSKTLDIKRIITFITVSILIVGIAAEMLSLKIYGFSYLDRLSFRDRREDVETVYFRFEQIGQALSLSKTNSLMGVGLGNYFENLSFTKSYPYFHFLDRTKTIYGGAEYVHNIFGTFLAEGGLIGALIFFILSLKFIKDDWNIYKKGKNENILLITAFWGIYIYAMLHPFVPLSLQGAFWVTRGMLATRK
jgi:O-antigen ligase